MTKLNIDIADILGDKFPHGFHVPVDIGLETFIEWADDEWTHELDIDTLLQERDQVAVIWGIDAVKIRRPDLTREQAWEVLLRAREDYLKDSCDLDFIESTADGMFPKKKTYRVCVSSKVLESYEVDAESEEDAEELWMHGRLCGTDDSEPHEILTVEEVLS